MEETHEDKVDEVQDNDALTEDPFDETGRPEDIEDADNVDTASLLAPLDGEDVRASSDALAGGEEVPGQLYALVNTAPHSPDVVGMKEVAQGPHVESPPAVVVPITAFPGDQPGWTLSYSNSFMEVSTENTLLMSNG